MEYVNQNILDRIKTDVDALKYKAILNYMNFAHKLEKGYKIDYLNILEIISLVDIYSALDNNKVYYKDFYLNE